MRILGFEKTSAVQAQPLADVAPAEAAQPASQARREQPPPDLHVTPAEQPTVPKELFGMELTAEELRTEPEVSSASDQSSASSSDEPPPSPPPDAQMAAK